MTSIEKESTDANPEAASMPPRGDPSSEDFVNLGRQFFQLLKKQTGQLSSLWRPQQRIRPFQIRKELQKAMVAPEHCPEDVEGYKMVPNIYEVELNESVYEVFFQPIKETICDQLAEGLHEHLSVMNRRSGRKEYVCLGEIQVKLKPVSDLPENKVNITCQMVLPDDKVNITSEIVQAGKREPQEPGPFEGLPLACLEGRTNGEQWLLHNEMVTIGRDEKCDVCMDMPIVQEKSLVSNNHAYILYENKNFRLFDGSREGRRSTNGTFVNGELVRQDGHRLQDGDTIILAALDANDPRPDTEGVVELIFRLSSA